MMAPHPDLLAFGIALELAGALGYMSVPRVFEFFEKPWSWADEFETWLQAGRPMDYADPGWATFADEAIGVSA
jgi:hypothetical protein